MKSLITFLFLLPAFCFSQESLETRPTIGPIINQFTINVNPSPVKNGFGYSIMRVWQQHRTVNIFMGFEYNQYFLREDIYTKVLVQSGMYRSPQMMTLNSRISFSNSSMNIGTRVNVGKRFKGFLDLSMFAGPAKIRGEFKETEFIIGFDLGVGLLIPIQRTKLLLRGSFRLSPTEIDLGYDALYYGHYKLSLGTLICDSRKSSKKYKEWYEKNYGSLN